MKHLISPWQLGATLYMPATRKDILEVIQHKKIAGLRSLIICLEDSVSEDDIPEALNNLTHILQHLNADKKQPESNDWPLLFIRPRNIAMAKQLTANFNLERIAGLVLPKFTLSSLEAWWEIMQNNHLYMMPTLETQETFDVLTMQNMADNLAQHECRQRIIALRIGGNDLLNVLSLRRPTGVTLYDTPLGYVIKMLASVFVSKGFALTAPVCELIDDQRILKSELDLDIANGLVGKTAIHPTQIDLIQHSLAVSELQYSDALKILDGPQAVFKSSGAMCEPATHRKWAQNIITRGQIYGIMHT
ncbi:HpcH/HpaI aldolase/citrate lyase family protein [Neisseriaceae bacterium ESL0693]|nr:HpcH/HpaI aldolase/citrate lyase family protein [Neisseriaceae bacterium ESL0693]